MLAKVPGMCKIYLDFVIMICAQKVLSKCKASVIEYAVVILTLFSPLLKTFSNCRKRE